MDAIYHVDGSRVLISPNAAGPWDPSMQRQGRFDPRPQAGFPARTVEDNLRRLGLKRLAIVPFRAFIDFIAAQRDVADQAKLPSELAASLASIGVHA